MINGENHDTFKTIHFGWVQRFFDNKISDFIKTKITINKK